MILFPFFEILMLKTDPEHNTVAVFTISNAPDLASSLLTNDNFDNFPTWLGGAPDLAIFLLKN